MEKETKILNESDTNKNDLWYKLGFLQGINDERKEKQIIKEFNNAIKFIEKNKEANENNFNICIFAIIRSIFTEKNVIVKQTYSIENVYNEYVNFETNYKEIVDECKRKNIDIEAEKCQFIKNLFIEKI